MASVSSRMLDFASQALYGQQTIENVISVANNGAGDGGAGENGPANNGSANNGEGNYSAGNGAAGRPAES